MRSAGQVHVWAVELDTSPDPFRPLLTADESDRAQRFHLLKHRERYIVGRGTLRRVLGEFLRLDPTEIHFDYGPFGKPKLRGQTAPHFNISHRENRAIVAVCEDYPVGTDIESVRRFDDLHELSYLAFNDRERRQMSSLPEHSRVEGFLWGWSRKEAYFKATGAGLSARLHDLTVDLRQECPRILDIAGGDARQWSVRNIPAPQGFLGALAIPYPEPVLIWHGELPRSSN